MNGKQLQKNISAASLSGRIPMALNTLSSLGLVLLPSYCMQG